MGSILSLRHYSHDQIVHSHDHAQWSWASAAASSSRSRGAAAACCGRPSRWCRRKPACLLESRRQPLPGPRPALRRQPAAGPGRTRRSRSAAVRATAGAVADARPGPAGELAGQRPDQRPGDRPQGAGLLLASLASERQPPRQQPACRWPAWTPTSTAMPPIRCRSPTWHGWPVFRWRASTACSSPRPGRRPWTTRAAGACTRPTNCCWRAAWRWARSPPGSATPRRAPSPRRWSASSASPAAIASRVPRQNRLAARQTNPSRLLTLCPSTDQESAWTSSNGGISNASNCASAPSSAPRPTPRHANPPTSSRSTSARSACAPPVRN